MKFIILTLCVFWGFAFSQEWPLSETDAVESTPITGLFINELMSHNDYAISDEYGEFDDWFEIYNANSYAVDIGGLYLTDSYGHPEKYQVPDTLPGETTIPAGGYLIVWADDQDSQGPLHTNFILNHKGEFLAIVQYIDNDFQGIDGTMFPAILPDSSYGRAVDGGPDWQFFAPSTPGESNDITLEVDLYDDWAQASVPQDISIGNYPNPFNPSTTITFNLPFFEPNMIPVRLTIFDILGRQVRSLFAGTLHAGEHRFEWNGLNDQGRTVPSNVYIYTLETPLMKISNKMLLIR